MPLTSPLSPGLPCTSRIVGGDFVASPCRPERAGRRCGPRRSQLPCRRASPAQPDDPSRRGLAGWSVGCDRRAPGRTRPASRRGSATAPGATAGATVRPVYGQIGGQSRGMGQGSTRRIRARAGEGRPAAGRVGNVQEANHVRRRPSTWLKLWVSASSRCMQIERAAALREMAPVQRREVGSASAVARAREGRPPRRGHLRFGHRGAGAGSDPGARWVAARAASPRPSTRVALPGPAQRPSG